MAADSSALLVSPLLVIGILPSDSSRRRGTAATCREHARATWLTAVTDEVVARFVHPIPPRSGRKKPRRRLTGQQGLEQTEEQRLQREASTHGDVIGLPVPTATACTCHELVHAWFVHAVAHWPTARYIGKTEDDVFISLPALRFELARLPGSEHGHANVWWGLMAWTGNGDLEHLRAGCWGGGFEDDPMLTEKGMRKTVGMERGCAEGAKPLAPATTHEVDIRSSRLASSMASCDFPRRWLASMGSDGRKCPNDCAAIQGLWLNHCLRRNVTLAHATWSKVHSNSLDNGWRPFAPPSNLSVVLDMNLGDKKLRQLVTDSGAAAPWKRVAAVMGASAASLFPPLLYAYDPTRQAGSPLLMTALNPRVAELHHTTCRWGGCHPSRGEAAVQWPAWLASSSSMSVGALGLS